MPLEDNTPSYSPTATLDRQPSVDTYPESDEVRRYRERQEANLSARSIEEQATPESVRDGLIDIYDEDDRSNLNYLQSGVAEPVRRSEVSPIAENKYADEPTEEEKMHKIVEQMPLLEQTKMIISTGNYIVNIVRTDALEMSRLER